MAKASTWADGFGRWHAIVADTPRGMTNAINAIADEVALREALDPDQIKESLNLSIISIPDAEPGYIHFAEYALEN